MHSTRSGHIYSHQSATGEIPIQGNMDDESDDGLESENYYESEDDEDIVEADDQDEESEDPYETIYAVDHCRQFRNNDFYAFGLGVADVKRIGIRFRSLQDGGEECSCNLASCDHIAWLKSQLGITNAQDGFHYLQNRSMARVCQEQGWEFLESDTDRELPLWTLKNERRRVAAPRRRRESVRDLLSTFDHDRIGEDFGTGVFDFALHSQEVLEPYNLEATLSRLLVHDDVVFRRFEGLVSRDRCDSEYFRKLENKFSNTLYEMDEYESTGALSNWNAIGPFANVPFQHDVPWCAKALVELVDSIKKNLGWRTGMSHQSQEQAVVLLVKMLDAVVSRNIDMYQNINWTRHPPRGEPSTHRNLYANLMGPQAENGVARGEFIVDALESLPDNTPAPFEYVDLLDRIRTRLGTVGYRAPEPYLSRLTRVVTRLRSSQIFPQAQTSAGLNTSLSSYAVEPSSSSSARRETSSFTGRGSSYRAGRGSSSAAGLRTTLGKRTARSTSTADRKGKRAMK